MNHFQLNEHEFNTLYTLCNNPFSNFALRSRMGFEPNGPDLEYIRRQDPARVWTMLKDEGGEMCLKNGYHYNGRIAFYLSVEPVPLDQSIHVVLDQPQGKSLFD
mgnify:CR=1 FL=1